jgi:hypothetical protein
MDWKTLDIIKRDFFNRLRKETSFDYSKVGFQEYKKRFERIPYHLLDEWKSIKEEYKNHPDLSRFKGALYEVLFYYACLELQALFFDAEILAMDGQEFPEWPPWFIAIPLYDIIPHLHQIRKNKIWERRVPQINADFIVIYTDDKGPHPPALIDVKSKKPEYKEEMSWQNIAALRMGFIFQVAYPKSENSIPDSLKSWEMRTPCSKCKKLSKEYRKCEYCGDELFPFTITDSYYNAKKLRGYLP